MKTINGITVKEGPADCIRMDVVAAALRTMKRLVRASSRNDNNPQGILELSAYWIYLMEL